MRQISVETPGVCENFAAGELKKFLELAGEQVSYTKTPAGIGGFRIATECRKGHDDAFRAEIVSGALRLSGNTPRATLYAVYDFLERFAGVRFVTGNCTVVPGGVHFPETGYQSSPSIPYRDYFCTQTCCDALFAARKRLLPLYGEEREELGFGITHVFDHMHIHNTARLAEAEIWSERCPDAFYEHTYPHGVKQKDVCFSTLSGILDGKPSPVADVVIKNLKAQILTNPTAKYFQIGQQDIPTCCPCEKCRTVTQRYGSPSAALIAFVNYVAREIRRWSDAELGGREIYIVTFAYEYTRFAPIAVHDGKRVATIRTEDNVCIRIAPSTANYAYSFSDPRQPAEFRCMFADWKLVTNRFFIWDYTINFYEEYWYFANLSAIAENYRFYRDLGAVHVFSEGSGNDKDWFVWQNDLRVYIASRLMWEPDADAAGILKEFCTLYYGDSAPVVFGFLRAFEEQIEKAKQRRGRYYYIMVSWGKRTLRPHHFSRAFLEERIAELETELSRIRMLSDEEASKLLPNSMETKTGAEKRDALCRRLQDILLTPRRMLLRNAKELYPNLSERRMLARKVLNGWRVMRPSDAWRTELDRLCKMAGEKS